MLPEFIAIGKWEIISIYYAVLKWYTKKIRFIFLSYLRALSSSPVYDVPAIEDNIELLLIRVLHIKIVLDIAIS